ncbi:hypothetical protein Pcinc_041911 [Petrolisthes cinctipes]|uniref:Uncharacterized protein n=1 Tax=Petrolisthes cinctipes TaxID=88211 RepID=A0AAE1BIJ4_PETCI|nr:hypothetical protein Pcinc_041911 [Petrolisthes cinctipes]
MQGLLVVKSHGGKGTNTSTTLTAVHQRDNASRGRFPLHIQFTPPYLSLLPPPQNFPSPPPSPSTTKPPPPSPYPHHLPLHITSTSSPPPHHLPLHSTSHSTSSPPPLHITSPPTTKPPPPTPKI